MVRILDLYCGMGGLSLGFALAIEGAEVVGLDIDRGAVDTYNVNLSRFGARAFVQDVLAWCPRGEYDVVIGGSPCQPFSLANTSKRGEKHHLFPTFVRFFDVVLAIKPKLFLLENVKGLIMKRHRHYLEQQIARVSSEYVVEWRVLNAVNYGVPQRRERLIVIGVRRELGKKPVFPKPSHDSGNWVTLYDAIGDLLAIPPAIGDNVVLSDKQVARIRMEREDRYRHWGRMEFPDSLSAPSRTIASHTIEGTKRETIVVPIIEEHVMTCGGGWDNPRSEWGSRVMNLGNPSYTITEKHRSGQLIPSVIGYRRLTVREALRIQSFPDWWHFTGISISKRFKLVGEAVPPIFAYRLALSVSEILGLRTRLPPRREEWMLPYFDKAFYDFLL